MADDFVVDIRLNLNAANFNQEVSRSLGTLNNQFTGFDKKIQGAQKALDSGARSANNLAGGMSNARYALYDVSTTLTALSLALGAVAIGTASVAIAWERDFANVARTTGLVGNELADMRTELVTLAQTLPASFADITKIATLGAQLGVADNALAGFTETTIKFSAATGISAEQSAQAFGRLGNILGIAASQYDNLGSSIVKAGVSAVATEAEIVAVAQQIGPIARLAGASAHEVVGLATAFASVKIPPELARSVITKTFGDIERAIAGGGEKLEAFGAQIGTTGARFAQAWRSDSTETFLRLLDSIPTTGSGAIQALDQLGLSSQRNTPALQKLAQNVDLVRNSLADAEQGFTENTELNRQYNIIAETTAARLQVLAQNFQAFLDAIGSANLGPLGDLIDYLSQLLRTMTDFASTDIGGRILGIITILAGVGGILAAAGAGLALFGASTIAMRQGLVAVVEIAPRASAAILGAGTASQIANGQMKSAAISARLFANALKILGAVTVVLALPDFANWYTDSLRAIQGISTEFEASFDRLGSGLFEKMDFANISAEMLGFGRALGDVMSPVYGDIKRVDEALTEMAKNGSADEARRRLGELRQEFTDAGGSAEQFKALFIDTTNALKDTTGAAAEAAPMVDELAAAEEAAAAANEAFAASLGLTADGLADMQSNLSTGSQAFFDMAAAIESATSEAGFSIETFIAEMQAQVDAQANFADNLGALAARGATNFASELAKGGPESAAAAAALVGASDEELAKLEELARIRAQNSSEEWAGTFTSNVPLLQAAYKYGGDAAVQSMQIALSKGSGAVTQELINMRNAAVGLPIEIYAENDNALATLNALQRQINATTGTVTIYAQYSSGALQTIRDPLSYTRNYATGGAIYGPGTGTSDSILARVSNGEYVVKAAAVDRYGRGFLDAVNNMRLPRFASGGSVGGGNSSSAAYSIVELGPRSMARLNQQVTNNIMLDYEGLSRAVEQGNKMRRLKGDLN